MQPQSATFGTTGGLLLLPSGCRKRTVCVYESKSLYQVKDAVGSWLLLFSDKYTNITKLKVHKTDATGSIGYNNNRPTIQEDVCVVGMEVAHGQSVVVALGSSQQSCEAGATFLLNLPSCDSNFAHDDPLSLLINNVEVMAVSLPARSLVYYRVFFF